MQSGLSRFAAKTHALVLERLGEPSKLTTSIEGLLDRHDAGKLVDGDFYRGIFSNQPTLKMQKSLSAVAHAVAEQEALAAYVSSDPTVTLSDMVQAYAARHYAWVLNAPVKIRRMRIAPDVFIAWMRWYLALPQLRRIGNASDQPGFDYPVESCMESHAKGKSRLLDASANHANSRCPSASGALHYRHTLLKWAIYHAAKEAGCSTTMEPRTHTLLLEQFSAARCRTLFAKRPNKKQKAMADDLQRAIKRWHVIPEGEARQLLGEQIKQTQSTLERQLGAKKGLRIDVQITDPVSGQETWVDTTCIHPTCASRLAKEVKLLEEQLKDPPRTTTGRPALRIGQAVQDQAALKVEHYQPLVNVAQEQVNSGRREEAPTFFPAVVSTHGELGKATQALIERLTHSYGLRLAREGDRKDGAEPATLTARFRNELRCTLKVAAAKGLGRMLLASGLPFCKKQR